MLQYTYLRRTPHLLSSDWYTQTPQNSWYYAAEQNVKIAIPRIVSTGSTSFPRPPFNWPIKITATDMPSVGLSSCLVWLVQDEERDVFAVVTGLFEQAFTISKELPPGSGGRTSSGMGNATKTEG